MVWIIAGSSLLIGAGIVGLYIFSDFGNYSDSPHS